MAVGLRCEIALQPKGLRPLFDVSKQLHTAHKIGIVCGEADSLAAAQSTLLRHRRSRQTCALPVHESPHWTELTLIAYTLRTGGTGVTPFVRILRKLRAGGSSAPAAVEVCVVTSNRCAADILYAQELAAMGGMPRNPRSAD